MIRHGRARDDLRQPARRSLRRTTSSTRAKPGCLSTTATGPIGSVTSAVGIAAARSLPRDDDLGEPARDAVLRRVLRERRRARPSSRPGRCRSACSGSGPAARSRQSCIPLRGSPTFSPTTSTPLPVTTQFTPGSGLIVPSGAPRFGARATAAAPCRRGSRSCRSRSSRTRAARSGSCPCRAAGRGTASARRPSAWSTQSTGLGEIWCIRSEKMLRPRERRSRSSAPRSSPRTLRRRRPRARPSASARTSAPRGSRREISATTIERPLDVGGVPAEVPVRELPDRQARAPRSTGTGRA